MIARTSGPFAFEATVRSPFVFDLRAVGVFRMLLALTILFDQCVRLGDWQAFHSVAGLVSLADSRAWESAWLWSLYWLSDSPALPVVLEALRFVASIALLLGIRSRAAAFVLFAVLASLAARNPLVLQHGDRVLIVMTFFAAFLPLGERLSLSRLWFGGTSAPLYRSAATAAYAVQVLLVFFMAGILKTGDPWWPDGTAISMALHLEAFTSEFARLWRHWDWLVKPLTWFVFWLECLAPLLALVPSYYSRLVGLGALIALEIGIYLSLEVGLFPLISVVSLVPLAPPRLVDGIARLLSRRVDAEASDLVLFYDRDCRFCAFACRFLLAATATRGAEVREAQSDPVAARILDDDFAWSVAEHRAATRSRESGEAQDGYRQSWAAVLLVVARSPHPWLARLLPGLALGERLYAWIGRHRGAIGGVGGMAFGRGRTPGWHGEAGRFVAASALTVVLAWNVVTYPSQRESLDLRPLVEPLIATFNLKQYWNMFAPYPYLRDYWHAVPALARDGRRVDLLSGRPVSLEPPRDGPDRYGGYRWRKTVYRSQQRGELDRVAAYFCRTGRWAAFDVWEFGRDNLGVAATADAPYEAARVVRWRCEGAEDAAVEAFRADVDAWMPTVAPDEP